MYVETRLTMSQECCFKSVQCEHGEVKVAGGDSLAHTGFCALCASVSSYMAPAHQISSHCAR